MNRAIWGSVTLGIMDRQAKCEACQEYLQDHRWVLIDTDTNIDQPSGKILMCSFKNPEVGLPTLLEFECCGTCGGKSDMLLTEQQYQELLIWSEKSGELVLTETDVPSWTSEMVYQARHGNCQICTDKLKVDVTGDARLTDWHAQAREIREGKK